MAAPAQAQAVGVVAGAIVVVVSLIISISFLWLLGKKSNLLIPKAYAEINAEINAEIKQSIKSKNFRDAGQLSIYIEACEHVLDLVEDGEFDIIVEE